MSKEFLLSMGLIVATMGESCLLENKNEKHIINVFLVVRKDFSLKFSR